LLENLARRHPGSLELMREIAPSRIGVTPTPTSARKMDFIPDYIATICYLLEHGEKRLLAAVEPLSAVYCRPVSAWKLPSQYPVPVFMAD
jgi:hypothetical protein